MVKPLAASNNVEMSWFEEAKKLLPGESIFLEVKNKAEQTKRMLKFQDLLNRLEVVDPVRASQVAMKRTKRDGRLWVEISMLNRSPLDGFIKKADGSVVKKSVTLDPDRRRRIKLMVSDGVSLEEINEALDYDLTTAEWREFIEKGRM